MKTISIIGSLLLVVSVTACAGSKKKDAAAEVAVQGKRGEDGARCEYEGRDDRDVRESSMPGSIVPNIRRVYGYIGSGGDRRRILLCREADTNLDGIKDVVRTYGDNGERLTELADADFDGRIDTWITFGKSKPIKAEFDRNGDGKPDETRFYTGGAVGRIQRDTNADEKPDVFEIYVDGRLERMGIDADYDGQVDAWQRDQVRAKELQEKERAEVQAEKNESAASAE